MHRQWERPVVIVGVDAHKPTHTLVAVDEVARKLGERTVSATPDGHLGDHLVGAVA